MAREIIENLRNHPQGSRLIAEFARHSHAESHAARVVDAQQHLGEHIKEHHGGSVDDFVYFAGCDPDVLVKAVVDYGRKNLKI